MNEQDPQIFELDPDKAPRMTAIILLMCGLMGVGFLLVNVVFTGEDPYYDQQAWDEGNEPVNQRFDIMPNLVRGKHVGEDSEEDEEAKIVPIKKPKPKAAATSPYQSPYLQLNRPTTPTTVPSSLSAPKR